MESEGSVDTWKELCVCGQNYGNRVYTKIDPNQQTEFIQRYIITQPCPSCYRVIFSKIGAKDSYLSRVLLVRRFDCKSLQRVIILQVSCKKDGYSKNCIKKCYLLNFLPKGLLCYDCLALLYCSNLTEGEYLAFVKIKF